MSGKRASVVFGPRSGETCVWVGNEHGREERSGGRYRMGWSECTRACLAKLGGSCGSCGTSLGSSSEVLDAGEDTKLKVGEEGKLVSGDDSDDAESLELKAGRRYRLFGTSSDSIWVAGYDGTEDERVFVARADDGTTSL